MADTLGYPPLRPTEPDEEDAGKEPPDNHLYRLLALAYLAGVVVLIALFWLMLILLARASS
ncbi:MAG TPA: hypothetical protein VFU32_00935 [Ktedonobacterales bacterium]|nr:hypothetical protein [Ktedonobacterales bacterium]